MTAFRRSAARNWLPIAGFVFALLISAGAALSILQSRDRELAAAGQQMNSLALALTEQTDRAFQAVELVQTSLAKKFEAESIRDRRAFDTSVSTEEVSHSLYDAIRGLPQVDAIALIRTDGQLLNFSRYWPIPNINVSDRDYFKALSSDPKLTSFVSAPVENRGSGTWTVYLARKVTGQGGEFLGLVLGAIKLEHFEQFYAALALGPNTAVTLLRRDGVMLAHYPPIAPMIGRSLMKPSAAVRDAAAKTAATVRQISPVDGTDRLIAARASSRYPLTVAVSDQVQSILADWRYTAFCYASAAIIIDLLIAAAVFLGMRQLKEQRRITSFAHCLAREDPLTSLPNRLSLRETMATCLSQDIRFSLLCIDLDQFKAINDSFGHPAGDELLRAVAVRLKSCVRADDLVARTGGDEFAVVHVLANAQDDGSDLAEVIIRNLALPVELQGSTVQIGASIGLANRPEDGDDDAELMRNADLALYRAKAEGRDQWRRFEPVMAAQVRTERAIERDLSHAIEHRELSLHFQPIVDIATGLPRGFEALLRWTHPERGLVPPSEFIPIAEAAGLIVPIGEWVIRNATTEASRWPERFTVAVNLSPAQLGSGRVVESVRQALQTSGLNPRRLELEITETALLSDSDAVLGALHKLRTMGVLIALDDFGAGYSSLSYVTSFRFDRIKIDRSFVQKMTTSEASLAVIDTIIHLAKRVGVSTTGEGVETPEQLDALRKLGCTEAQGFYFGKPQPAAEIRRSFNPVLKLVHAA